MNMRALPVAKPADPRPSTAPLLQRRPTGTHAAGTGECAQCRQSDASCAASKAPCSEGGKPNRTGLPDHLKRGLEELSGFDLSDVRVHRDSPKPALIQAHAYTYGRDIHISPGQEHYLPHEGWHAVQQMQSRVGTTSRLGTLAFNDDSGLEREADAMGAKAEARGRSAQNAPFATMISILGGPTQDEPFRTAIAGRVKPVAPPPVTQAARVVQRASSFVAGTVTSTTNLAAHVIAGNFNAGYTPPTLNGSVITSIAAAQAAIVAPTLQGQCNVDGTDTEWVSTVGTNTGSYTMQLPAPGPWSTVTPKASFNAMLSAGGASAVPACATAGDTTFTVNGKPTNATFVANVTTHENLHAADHRAGFATVIGAWDARLVAASAANTRFTRPSHAAAEAALWTAMGGTPADIAAAQFTEWIRLNNVTHTGTTLATGGVASGSNLAVSANCSTTSIDLT
jgi:hypothetical protein